ncbi:hypothetical protein [Roseibium album]|uniref:hypothetical protein n=1 Tax=Roseibium album TaxID=311410 RepID=UPI000CF0247B|nr:polyhydroxyalkanoate synthesis regulator phasin [Labrenzia sp. EL_142]MBG6203122.1 polyhydroxyalkanoate synthesis regulator phasin [Labrenzia sp. EL_13]MCR9059639.1 hypothetical protein [Paracoccaceae bacterium]
MMPVGAGPALPPPGASPRDQAVNALDTQVEDGEITTEEADAMLAALDAIHEDHKTADASDFAAAPPSGEDIQARFDTMLSDQVETGALTQDLADQLSAMFENGDIGPPPPPPGGSTSENRGSDMDADMREIMNAILEETRNASPYAANGRTAFSGASPLLADFEV